MQHARFSAACRVFDLDGLLFNTEELYQFVGSELMRAENIRRSARSPRDGPTAPVAANDDRLARLDVTVEILAAETEQVFAEILGERLEFMPGLVNCLQRWRRTIFPKRLPPAAAPIYAPCAWSAAIGRTILVYLNVRRRAVRQTRSGGLSARRGQIRNCAAEMMVLEDSQNGCQAAVAAGAFAVAVPGPHNRGHEFPGPRSWPTRWPTRGSTSHWAAGEMAQRPGAQKNRSPPTLRQ